MSTVRRVADGLRARRASALLVELTLQLIEQAEELEAHNRRVLEAIALVRSAADGPGLIEKDPATFEALSVMLWRRTVRFPRAAYEELVATGNLRRWRIRPCVGR